MRTVTSLSRRLGLLVAAAVALALAPGAAAQSELVVQPGNGTLNTAIENDTARPADRVYVLQRGAYYGVTREINNQGYVLRIKAAEGDGNRPVVYPGIDDTGTPVDSRYFNLANDTYFDGIYFLAVNSQQGENATSFALNGAAMRFVVDDCVFQGGHSRLIEINSAETKLLFTNSQFRNLIRNDGSSNGRPIDYRTVTGDSLVFQNTSFLNVSGYLVRYNGSLLRNVIFEHNTIYVTNHELMTNSFGTQTLNFRFTNNLVVNPYGLGQAPEDDPANLRDGVIRFDSLGVPNGFTEADRQLVIRNNGYMITDDLQAFYDQRTASGDPLESYALVDDEVFEYAAANPSAVLRDNETYDIDFVAPPDLSDYIAWLGKFRDGSKNPGTWTFGQFDANGNPTDNLFPATQPPPEDLSYSVSNPAYTAAQGGFPLGDLNYFPPAILAAYEAGGGLAVSSEDGPAERGFAIRTAYPNPTAGAATVTFDLDAASTVVLDVYDSLGRRVLTVPSRAVAAGASQQVAVDASGLPSGIYLLRMTAEAGGSTRVQTSRLTVVR